MITTLPPVTASLDLLSKINKKLGLGIVSWSISCGVYCPGMTESCSKCYGQAMEDQGIHAPSIKKGWANRGRMTETADSLATLELRLTRELCKLEDDTPVRIHVGGDFHSTDYIRMWARLAKRFPSLIFFGYTRSWRVSSLLPELEVFRAQPNVHLMASMDKHCSLPPRGWRYAMMGSLAGKPAPGTILCPELNGKLDSCSQCKACFNSNLSIGITFPIHQAGRKQQAARDWS